MGDLCSFCADSYRHCKSYGPCDVGGDFFALFGQGSEVPSQNMKPSGNALNLFRPLPPALSLSLSLSLARSLARSYPSLPSLMKRSESAREWIIAPYRNDHHHLSVCLSLKVSSPPSLSPLVHFFPPLFPLSFSAPPPSFCLSLSPPKKKYLLTHLPPLSVCLSVSLSLSVSLCLSVCLCLCLCLCLSLSLSLPEGGRWLLSRTRFLERPSLSPKGSWGDGSPAKQGR